MLVALDRQHQGKPSGPDPGAIFPDGTTEAQHAERYGLAAKALLEHAGVNVMWITKGEYRDRNRAANGNRAALYVACHVNAGATDPSRVYALTEYDIDAGIPKESRRAGQLLVAEAAAELSERAVGPKGLKSGERGHVCVGACAMPAVIYEPEFTIAARDDVLVGHALAKGICAFLGVPYEPPLLPPSNPVVHHVHSGGKPVAFFDQAVSLDKDGRGSIGPKEGFVVPLDKFLGVSGFAIHDPNAEAAPGQAHDPDYIGCDIYWRPEGDHVRLEFIVDDVRLAGARPIARVQVADD